MYVRSERGIFRVTEAQRERVCRRERERKRDIRGYATMITWQRQRGEKYN